MSSVTDTATTTKQRGRKRTDLSAVRDTVESIWVAIVLAAVLRAFMFEAFVIPTGSMAPRLMGDHQGLVCPDCMYRYAFGMPRGYSGLSRSGKHTAAGARCPSCGAPYRGTSHINSGDRVLVLKYLYRFREPRPWEVVVFKNPQDNRENYIKRLVGTPGRMIEIVHGDIFYREGKDRNSDDVIDEKDFDFNDDGKTDIEDFKDTQGLKDFPWRICRKPARAQDAMWQVIFDNDYRPSEQWLRDGNPPRWVLSQGWTTANAGREFVFEGGASPAELRFEADEDVFRPHYGYNTRNAEQNSIDPTVDICGDLKLSLVFMPKGADSQIALMTTSFDDQFRAELRADGSAGLLHRKRGRTDWTDGWPRTNIGPLRPGRNYQVALVHVDSCVELWVDGKRVLSSADTEYSDDRRAYSFLKDRLAGLGAGAVLAPQVAIEADGGGCELRHVRLHRDVYYTTPRLSDPPTGPAGHIARRQGVAKGQPGWGTTGNPIVLRRHLRNRDMDEFFMLGDNSPQSLDGRAWVAASPTLRPGYRLGTVPRYSLIGRALFVYWPAGFRPPGFPRLPILPNVGRMRLIR